MNWNGLTVYPPRLAIGLLLIACAGQSGPPPGPQQFENFDSDSGWTGFHNFVDLGFQTVTQDFGYKTSNFAGVSAGEIGGTIVSSLTPAYYGTPVAKTLDDTLTCTGKFFVKDVYYNGGFTEQSWLWFGWFNSGFQGWQPTDFVGMGFPGYRLPDHTKLFVQFGTGHGVADRAQVDFQIDENVVAHSFDLQYDPSANDNKGAVTLSIDGVNSATINLQSGFKAQGADLNRFGVFANNLPSGKSCEIYLDDLVVNGVSYDFDSDPSWIGSGNNVTFDDYDLYGANDYGYSGSTNFAGGADPGEIGGQWWNVHSTHDDYKGYYADTDIGTFGFDKPLMATGTISIQKWSIDSGLHFGWFNATEQGWPPKNLLGIHMDSITNNGRFIQAMVGASDGGSGAGDLIYYVPDGTPHDFTIEYNPEGGGAGQGQLTFTLDGASVSTVDLTAAQRSVGASFDAFGVFNKQNENGKDNYVYFDDLNYTVNILNMGISENLYE